MNKKTSIYGFVGLLVSGAIVGGLSLASVAQTNLPQLKQNPQNPPTQTMPRQRGMMMGNVDRHFIEMMIPHHEGAIDMAKLALNRAEHPEIKKLARSIIDDQQREIEQMRTWYRQWYGTEVPATPMTGTGMMGMRHCGMMGMDVHLDTLENASEFDREFIREMIPHHQMAVMMSRMVINGGTQLELRNLAQSIIATQTDEIDKMSQWYETWYGYARR
jgi:uncharacterized protein (DUF305 family)